MAKPKLALVPAAQGSKFYSVLPSDGVGDFDFARASAATRINKYGLIETVASGQSRLNYPLIDGVVNGCPHHILESQRINLVTYSEDFSNVAWSKSASTITSNAAISPDGTLNASLFESTGAAGYMFPSSGILSSAANGTFTYSIYAKEGNTSSFAILIAAATNYRGDFNLTSVEASTSTANTIVDISNAGNGWYRCSVTASLVASSAYSELQIGRISLGSNLYFYGAQLEQGYPTSYIPTTSSATTRVAETANNSGDASTFNDSEGVLMVEAAALSNDGTYRNICLSDGGLTNRILIQYTPTSNQINIVVIYSGGQYSLSHTVSNVKDFSKFLIKYKANDLALWVNGFEVDTSANSNLPIGLNTLSFDNTIGDAFYSNTKQIQYFDSALNDSELETLTSWTSFSEMATSQLYSIQ
jgi:hypothetical protein